jgi:hypothetical protein
MGRSWGFVPAGRQTQPAQQRTRTLDAVDPGSPDPRKSGLQRIGASYSRILRRRRAFETTDTELRLMAAPAIIGFRASPKNG